MQIDVIVEIPKGSRNKYEIDHDAGAVWLDRHLFTATAYPADYGFVPDTLAEDGDPLDALVILDEPTVPGCHIHVRPIGVFWMRDEAGPDAKLLCVPDGDPRYEGINDLDDVSEYLRAEIKHFFEIYKALEPSKHTEVRDWSGREEAERQVQDSRKAFKSTH
jgi:inorganic pyrophosphatase